MAAPHVVDPHGLLDEVLAEASPNLMCTMLQRIINKLLFADADAVASAERGRPSPRYLVSTPMDGVWSLGRVWLCCPAINGPGVLPPGRETRVDR